MGDPETIGPPESTGVTPTHKGLTTRCASSPQVSSQHAGAENVGRLQNFLNGFPDNAEKLQRGMGYVFDIVRDGADALGVLFMKGTGAAIGAACAYVAWRIARSDDLEAVVPGLGLGLLVVGAGRAVAMFMTYRTNTKSAASQRREDSS